MYTVWLIYIFSQGTLVLERFSVDSRGKIPRPFLTMLLPIPEKGHVPISEMPL